MWMLGGVPCEVEISVCRWVGYDRSVPHVDFGESGHGGGDGDSESKDDGGRTHLESVGGEVCGWVK